MFKEKDTLYRIIHYLEQKSHSVCIFKVYIHFIAIKLQNIILKNFHPSGFINNDIFQIRDSRVTLGRTFLLGKKFVRRVTFSMDMQTGRRGNLKKSLGSSAVASR